MFINHPLYDYIVPIYNDKNLDDVLKELGYPIDIKHKAKSYLKIFPSNNGDYNQFLKVKNILFKSKNSNISSLLDYLDICYKEYN